MKKREFCIDRRRNKRVCECGGNLKLIGVDYDFMPHTRCLKCGKEHVGITGTKKASDD